MEGFKFKVKRRSLKHNSFNTTIDRNEKFFLKKKKEDGGLGREISLNAWKMLTSMEITQRRHSLF